MPITSKKQSSAKQAWDKKHRKIFGLCAMIPKDNDIIEYLEGKQASTIIKQALREYMERHKEGAEQ